jgi:hypothetical protein
MVKRFLNRPNHLPFSFGHAEDSMGEKQEPAVGQRLVHGLCGAFLAALAAKSVQFLWTDINWWVVGVCAAFGFLLAWFVGEQAIEFLKWVFWWS